MIKNCYTYLIAFLLTNIVYSQQISVDNSIPVQQLIIDNMVMGCVEITNVTSTVNGSVNGFSSFAYFQRASSNFPFQDGIMLSTGNANSGGNTLNTNTLNDGTPSWGTDPDLETALGISNTLNATSIEFDFVSISNTIQFNYILASEEYYGQYPCEYSDGFAFLIRPTASAGPYQNIALVPGTSTPVNTFTVHDEIVGFCPEQNGQYFEGYNLGDTNYNGRTRVLTATAGITPYTQYHIKLIIADQTDQNYDSAVFIEGNSFSSVVDLGEDITTCADALILNADIQNNQASYSWYLNNNLIPGENNPTLNVNQSGTYRVEVAVTLNNTNCVLEDEIIINLSSEQTGTPLSDYELCDDASNDGAETFDLSTRDAEVLASVPPANYSFSYHYSLSDAQNNINPITASIPNTLNPQIIHVRIEDLDSGCLAFSTLNLIVNPFPNVATNNTIDVCDTEDADGITEIDLTSFDPTINNGQANLAVSYYFTQSDADQGINAIPSPYVNTNPYNENLYVRVLDTSSGCYTTAVLNINIIQAPAVNTDTQYIDACDQQHDGFASFDLTSVLADVLMGVTGVSTSFHTSYEDALSGSNPIANISNFDNTIYEEQVLYIRVEDDTTGCTTIVPLEVHPNLLLTGTEIEDFAFCDNDGDGLEEINLNLLSTVIDGDIPNVNITFYESQDDLNNGINALDESQPYSVTGTTTLYITLNNGSCQEEAEITIYVNANINTGPIDPINYCDDDDDGLTAVDLYSLDPLVTNNNPNLNVRYFDNALDAENGTNQLPGFYSPISNPQTIHVRIEDVNTACYTTNSFELTVLPAPTTATPGDMMICDMDSDGYSIINLNDLIPVVVSDTTDLTISFFTSEQDANDFTNVISNPGSFNTITTPIWIRVESDITNCYALETFQIYIYTLPVIPNISDFQQCEDDNDYTTDFYLIDKDLEILNGFTDKEVFYYESAADADANTNPIDKNNAYQNTSNPQTIYIRVENFLDPTCYSTGSFIIEVAPNPIFNEPTDYVLCDDISNDGEHQFDLNEKITEISQGSPDTLDITFHETQLDAQNNANALPMQYTNSNNPQQVYVRVQNQTFCTIITSFGINIIASPEVSESQPLTVCDDNSDGISTFNLEDALFDILDVRQNDIEITYFESMTDLEMEINEIQTPTSYSNSSNPQTVFIRVTNTVTLCYQAIPLDLIVNFPPEINTVGTIEICENIDNSYDLTLVNGFVVDDATGLTISYYETLADAESGQNNIIGDFIYSSPNTTIYIRLENESTGCYSTDSFVLVVHSKPFVANPAPNMEECDDDYDGLLVFDLTDNIPIILGSQNSNDFTLTFYNTQMDAEGGSNSISTLYEAYNNEIIYVRVENNDTGCYYVTQFNTTIHPKPMIDLDDIIPLCLDDLPLTVNASTNNPGDTYLWSTGETTASIDIYPDGLGDYWVTATTPFGCETTSNFTVIQSEIATINFTTTVDFANPNSITVDIGGGGDYIFALDQGPWQTSNFFEPVTLGLHTVTVRDINGCNDVSEEVVVIDAPLFMTPNDDGYFDSWHIVGIEQLPGTIVYIFDRYGKLLKTLDHLSQGWDGTFRGYPMPADDYWFLAEVKRDDSEFEVKGHFTLKR